MWRTSSPWQRWLICGLLALPASAMAAGGWWWLLDPPGFRQVLAQALAAGPGAVLVVALRLGFLWLFGAASTGMLLYLLGAASTGVWPLGRFAGAKRNRRSGQT